MISDAATLFAVGLAKALVKLVKEVEPDWRDAYMRLSLREGVVEAKASYVHASGAELFDVLQHKDFFHSATREGRELMTALGKERGVFLLIVDSTLNYEFKFEHINMDRWRISKMRGGTGVPEGLEQGG